MGGKQTKHELLGGHFQGEESDIMAWANEFIFFGVVALTEHVASHAEGESGFAHARAGGENNHFPRFEARGELVELIEAGGDPAVVALAFDEPLDDGDSFGGDLGGAQNSFGFAAPANF